MTRENDWAKIIVVSNESLDRMRHIPHEIRAAVEQDNKKQALALLQELEQATRFFVKD